MLMPHTKNSRFDVSAFMKARKEARQKAVQECRSLKSEHSTNTRKINKLKSKVSGSSCCIKNACQLKLLYWLL